MPRPTPPPTEHEIQSAFVRLARSLDVAHPDLALLYAVPNGGYRSKATAGQMKAEGARAGVPDLVLPARRSGRGRDGAECLFGALYLEFKTKTGRASPEQRAYAARLEAAGQAVVLVRSEQAALDATLLYLGGKLDLRHFPRP